MEISVSTTILVAFLIFFALKTVAETALTLLNRREMLKNQNAVPAEFQSFVDAEKYKQSVAYSLAQTRFELRTKPYDIFWQLFWILGIYALIFGAGTQILALADGESGWAAIWREGVIFIAISIIMGIPDLPIDFLETFRLEAKFGFNKSTKTLWATDQIKEIAVEIVLGLPLAWLLFAIYHAFPQMWWVLAQIAFFAIQLVLMVLYPKLILPLFNKLTPLPEGELRDALVELANRAGFVAKKIEVIDGSKRSGHSNAYFTGFGKWRRIVIYDTLIQQLSTDEIRAVLAHEIGHSKRNHITKTLIFSFFSGFVGFGIIAAAIAFPPLFEAFGFEYRAGLMIVPAAFLVSAIAPLVLFWISPISAYFSRKHEYEADAYARELLGTGTPLISALRKLNTENLSNLTPHPWFVRFYYSHPTLLLRERALAAGTVGTKN